MSNGRKKSGWKFLIVILVFSFIVPLSAGLGAFIDVNILFPPRPDVLGHGIPVFTFLLPMLAIFIEVIILFIMAVHTIWRAVSSKRKHYEYIKSFWKYSYEQDPVLTLHEIDLDAGRRGVRCIEIYRDGHKNCLVNNGMQDSVPTVETINGMGNYTAYRITEQEFQDTWSR